VSVEWQCAHALAIAEVRELLVALALSFVTLSSGYEG
jgi:hypothetical protein